MSEIFSKEMMQQFGDDYVAELTKSLLSLGKSASGKLIQSLDARVQETAGVIQIMIESEDYLQYVDEGRNKGSYPPISAISKWVRIKGIKQEAVFPIARSIYKFGIKPTNVLDKASRNFYNSNAFNKLENSMANELEVEIVNSIEKQLRKN